MSTETIPHPSSPVVSLSSGQVDTLLRTLNQHRTLLDVAHADARRLANELRRPAYVVDFELLYRYMFRGDERPDWEQEMRYLFELPNTTFVIGPGTHLEIRRLVNSTGILKGIEGDLHDLFENTGRASSPFGLDEATLRRGMARLNDLLTSPSFNSYAQVVKVGPLVDKQAFDTAIAALRKRRPNAAASANQADALNWAAVIKLRRSADELDLDFHPYLLTATKPLLDERSWSAEITAPVSREPAEAIYSEILLEHFPDPIQAQDHTVEIAFEAASLERTLKKSPAYKRPDDFQHEPEWENALQRNLLAKDLREQLSELTGFVTDPIVVETQRIYDNAHLASVSAKQQSGSDASPAGGSPRRLFDLIASINSALHANRGEQSLAELWSTALKCERDLREGHVTHRLLDADVRHRTYLTVEEYRPSADEKDRHFTLHWPCSANADDVIRFFSEAFRRHAADEVELVVGTRDQVQHFGADVPFTLKEIVFAVEDALGPPTVDEKHEIMWIRIAAQDFDVYADLLPPGPQQDPVIGLFVDQIDAVHITDLYLKTSARYLFPVWLQAALEAFAQTSPDVAY